jgi:hypothetical protein
MDNVGEMILGASGSRFPNGISADTTSPGEGEVRGTKLTITSTTTLPVNKYIAIKQALSFPASTTANVYSTQQVRDDAAYYTNNFGVDMVCDARRTGWNLTTAFGELVGSFRIGTTTFTTDGTSWTTTSTQTIYATTTFAATETVYNAPLKFATEARWGTYFALGDVGVASSTTFIVKSGESIVWNYDTHNATSGDSWLAKGHFTPAGYGVADCWIQ